jgi:hypothetical protein
VRLHCTSVVIRVARRSKIATNLLSLTSVRLLIRQRPARSTHTSQTLLLMAHGGLCLHRSSEQTWIVTRHIQCWRREIGKPSEPGRSEQWKDSQANLFVVRQTQIYAGGVPSRGVEVLRRHLTGNTDNARPGVGAKVVVYLEAPNSRPQRPGAYSCSRIFSFFQTSSVRISNFLEPWERSRS